MIKSLANIIESFIEKEKELVAKYSIIRHPGMIGEMYEGLTKEALNKALPTNIDLRVVSGKILTSEGTFSGQIDCMLVHGEGEKIPFTSSYIYNVTQVIAVIEVKKNLFGNDIENAFTLLNSFHEYVTPDKLTIDQEMLASIAFHMIFYNLKIHEHMSQHTLTEQHTYVNLIKDATNPLKIIWAYEGIKSEEKLRQALLKIIDKNIHQEGFEPYNFPDLIICKNNSVVKLNGMPLGIPFNPHGLWPFVGSNSDNPIGILITLIWTRLYYRFNLSPEIFGEGLTSEAISPLLAGQFVVQNNIQGWNFISTESDFGYSYDGHWEPAYLDNFQCEIILRLMKETSIDIEDEMMNQLLEKNKILLPALIQQLLNTDLVELKDSKISLINRQETLIGKTKIGFFAANINDPNFTKWSKTFKSGKFILLNE